MGRVRFRTRLMIERTLLRLPVLPDAALRSYANEVYCKILCHNICRLIQAIYELKIEPELLWEIFKKDAAD